MDILAALPQLVSLIEKLGVAGVLLIACGVLVYEIRRGRHVLHEKLNDLVRAYAQRDRARLAYMKCKAVLESTGVKVDLTDIERLMKDEKEEVAL